MKNLRINFMEMENENELQKSQLTSLYEMNSRNDESFDEN